MKTDTFKVQLLTPPRAWYSWFILLALMLPAITSAQRINLNFTAGADYLGSSETSPATPGGPAGTWNNISLAAANTDLVVTNADGSPGPTLTMDIGRAGAWTGSFSEQSANYTGAGAVFDVPNLYEAGIINAGNSTVGYRLKGLAPGTYAVHMVPMYRGYDPATNTYLTGIRLTIGTGNDTDARDSGDFTLVTTDANPEQNIDSSLTSWVAATDGSMPYNYVTAMVTIDSTNRWLTFLFEDGSDPDRPGPAVIQIESSGPPAPASIPVITESLLMAQGMVLRGTNGPATNTYQVLTSTNVTLPLSNWPSIGMHSFDLAGNFDSTNPVAPGASQQFFRLLAGGTLPPPPTGPGITTQPQDQTVLEGQNAIFSVAADGTAPLFYQWYFGASPLGGETGQTLTIEAAQTNDAGGYSVVVSNSVNSVTSMVATLTVNPAVSGGSSILVDDTWLDGTRTDTDLPDESAWFASSASTLSAAANVMTGTLTSSSATWWTYFTSSEGPATLNVGETLKATLIFTPVGVNTSSTSRGMRIGLYDFTDGTRRTSDGGSPSGTDVKGYMLNMNFRQSFGTSNPLEIRERADLGSGDLMGSSGDYTVLSAGGGSAGSPGFSNNVQYTLEFTVKRNASSAEITTTFSDGNEWSISHTAFDTNAPLSAFDCIALRPDGNDVTATNFIFSRCRVEITTSGPVPPSILTQPQSQTISQGENTTFMVNAAGTPPISHQWYFNTNTPLAGATNATLMISNAQGTNAGTYSVVVSNAVGSVSSAFATLTVTAPSAPTITDEPESETVFVSQSATFTVLSTGTSPLYYQWYFDTNTALAGRTNATLMITNAQTTNAGVYSVIVSNYLGTDTSTFATLTVDTNVSIVPSFDMTGYATLNGGATGGAGGATVTVSNFTDFNTYVGNTTTPYIIQVVGTINLGGSNVRVRNNKTIIGLGTNATLVGDLKVDGNNNVIIRNLNFTNPGGAGDNDGLTLQDCLNVWVDHCTFYDGADGNLDITHGADWITVSWCRFFYTNPGASHRFSNLVGHSDNNSSEDSGKLHVTFHHNWWGQYVHERMPRVRFGRIHSYNNFFNSPGNNYCFRVALGAEVRIENNYFLDVHNPWEVYVTTGVTGKVHAVNNTQVGTSFSVGDDTKSLIVPGTDTVFVPAYSYTLDPAANVPAAMTNYAGAGKGPYAP